MPMHSAHTNTRVCWQGGVYLAPLFSISQETQQQHHPQSLTLQILGQTNTLGFLSVFLFGETFTDSKSMLPVRLVLVCEGVGMCVCVCRLQEEIHRGGASRCHSRTRAGWEPTRSWRIKGLTMRNRCCVVTLQFSKAPCERGDRVMVEQEKEVFRNEIIISSVWTSALWLMVPWASPGTRTGTSQTSPTPHCDVMQRHVCFLDSTDLGSPAHPS